MELNKIYPESQQFIGKVTGDNIKARTEARFGLSRTNPGIKPIQTVKPDHTDLKGVKTEFIYGFYT